MSNIDLFKADLDTLKNKRSVLQAKLDDANTHVKDLMEKLKSLGYNSIDEAKAAYVKQLAEVEQQHEIVKKLIVEIGQIDQKVPTREEIAARLNALSIGDLENTSSNVTIEQSLIKTDSTLDIMNIDTSFIDDSVESNSVEVPIVNDMNNITKPEEKTNSSMENLDLGGLLFANL